MGAHGLPLVVPAHADTTADDFLGALSSAGITNIDPGSAVELGQSICPLLADRSWRMPASPLAALGRVYLSVFQNTTVESFRTEPYVFNQRLQGTRLLPGTSTVAGNDQTTPAQQRMVSLAFHTSGRLARAYAPTGWTFTDPALPPEARWVTDRDAFIRHALGLIGR